MITDFKKIIKLLNPKEIKKCFFLTFVKIISGVMDLIGVVSIFPFLTVLTNKNVIEENKYLYNLKEFLNFNTDQFIIFLGTASLFLIVANNLMRFLSLIYERKVVHDIWYLFHSNIFNFYLGQPYKFHIKNNSNFLLEKIQIQTNAATAGVVGPTFIILGNLFTTSLLFILLIFVNPIITILLILITGLFYISINFKFRKKLRNIAKFSPIYSEKTFKLVDQALRSIKDIKLKDNANFYVSLFNPLAGRYAGNQTYLAFLSNIPRTILEILVYVLVFSLVFYIISFKSGNLIDFIPLIGIYVFSLQKIIPAIQSIYQQQTEIKYYKPSFDKMFEDIKKSKSFTSSKKNTFTESKISVKKKIIFNNVEFSYEEKKDKVIDIKNLEIDAGKITCVTGKTGLGKTTLIDLLTGLLKPDRGQILIDEASLDNEQIIQKWRCNLGYIPQFPFIADDTIKNNIALGQEEKKIDFNKIKLSTDAACLTNFVEEELPEKYNTIIGENGIRLSGGQRQRLCIARSLYNNPEVLIFDESTNSLDQNTKNQILKNLKDFDNKKTLIMISHDNRVLMDSDFVVFFDDKKNIIKDTYSNLIASNTEFKNLISENKNN